MALLTFDCGGTYIKYGLFDQGLKFSGQKETPDSLEKLIDIMIEVKMLYKDHKLDGIALSLPGVVNNETGIIGGISAIPYIHNFNLKQMIEDRLGLKVTMENDANCAALAEVTFGVAQNYKDVVFIVIGTGIGGTIIIDKKLHRGSNSYAGELGIILSDEDKFMSFYTPRNIADRYNKEHNTNISGKDVFESNDLSIKASLDKTMDYLAKFIFNITYTIDPELFVIGGAISSNDTFIKTLNTKVNLLQQQHQLTDFTVTIKGAQYLNDANLIGAVAFFNQCYSK